MPIGETWQVYPWGGITFGYRFPSKELHSSWRKVRLLKRDKVSLLEQESGASLSSSKLNRIQRKSIREIERLEKESLRDLTRSAIYIEGFGAGLLWSLNYEYSFPLIKNELLQAFARTGVGVYPSRRRTDNQKIGFNVLTLPIIAGLRVMKNYRGGGVGGGIVPIVSEGRVRLGYVFNADLQIHITSGIIVGGGFNLLIGYFDEKPIYPLPLSFVHLSHAVLCLSIPFSAFLLVQGAFAEPAVQQAPTFRSTFFRHQQSCNTLLDQPHYW